MNNDWTEQWSTDELLEMLDAKELTPTETRAVNEVLAERLAKSWR